MMAGLRPGSRAVETTPFGLFTAQTSRGSASTRFPFTSTAAPSSTSRAGSVTTSPPTRTFPAAISSSAARRDAMPAWARYFASLIPRLKQRAEGRLIGRPSAPGLGGRRSCFLSHRTADPDDAHDQNPERRDKEVDPEHGGKEEHPENDAGPSQPLRQSAV